VLRKVEFKIILGQLAMATTESHCLTKQLIIYPEDVWVVSIQIQL